MQIRTLFTYLIGQRQAIRTVASSPHALWVGVLLVLSAALAREYDSKDLLREPWHLLVPLGAVWLAATLLFALINVLTLHGPQGSPLGRRYRSFLGLFFMTAPLAWLYATPFELFLSPLDAVRANLCVLGGVALWRVLLTARFVSVITRGPFLAALFPVLLFGDVVMLFALSIVRLNILNVMAGLRSLSESEHLIVSTAMIVQTWGMTTLLIWLIGTLFVCFGKFLTWSAPLPDESSKSHPVGAVMTASGKA